MDYLYYIKTYEYDKNNTYIVKSLNEQTISSIENILNNFINKHETDFNVINLIKLTKDKVNILLTDKKDYDEFCEALTKLIYFNNGWKIEYFNEPNFKILNTLDGNKLLMTYIIGNSFKDYINNRDKLDDLGNIIEKIYYIENKNIVYYNNKINNKLDIDTLFDYYTMFSNDQNKECLFVFDNSIGFDSIFLFFKKIKKYRNCDILLYSENIIFKMIKEVSNNELIFDQVYPNE